jgi:nitrogen regulatory protein P-II 1
MPLCNIRRLTVRQQRAADITDRFDDGKIFVSSIESAVRIRTGQRDSDTI